MTLSLSNDGRHNPQTLALPQTQPPISQDGIVDWMPSSAAGIVTYLLSKIAATDVAQVGDLMINGRDNAVLPERPPAKG